MTFQDFRVSNDLSNEVHAQTEAVVRRLQKAREIRNNFFGEDLFADPAWDMLLELYACELGQQRVSVSGVSNAANVPLSTALRWMAVLEEKNLVLRTNDPHDGRRVWISLTAQGASLMHRYFMATSLTSLAC